jgi:hypothetical protein
MVVFAIVITKALRVCGLLATAGFSASDGVSFYVEDQKLLALSEMLRN